ncbi:hypothetical protein QUF80_23045 [Desulfococcaceae bacterium HSG8]|nr:hypothetical protein [Desulfococcaceae bacterium HSG8]
MNETDAQEFIKIAVLESMIEAQVTESVLEEDGIPHMIRSYHDTAYDGLFQLQMGWGEITAPLSYKEKILKILEDVRAGIWETGESEGIQRGAKLEEI